MIYNIFKALHIIAFVAWFAGLFYLPRLFVYHASANDKVGIERFKVMQRRLYYGIMWPALILTVTFGTLIISLNASYYLTSPWMHIKLTLIALLIGYHVYCGHLIKIFKEDRNKKSSLFYRFFNEIPTVFLIAIVFVAVLK